MGALRGVFVLKSGLRVLILLILVIFPLKFPLKPKNFTANGRKCPTAKTKTVLESVNKMEQLVGMSKAKFGNSLK